LTTMMERPICPTKGTMTVADLASLGGNDWFAWQRAIRPNSVQTSRHNQQLTRIAGLPAGFARDRETKMDDYRRSRN
jgi:hypothetical protein